MRPLTCMKVFDEVGFETYTWTPTSKFLTIASVAGGYKFMYAAISPPKPNFLPPLLKLTHLQVRRSSQSLRTYADLPLSHLLHQPRRSKRLFPIRVLHSTPALPLAHGTPRANGELQRPHDRTTPQPRRMVQLRACQRPHPGRLCRRNKFASGYWR